MVPHVHGGHTPAQFDGTPEQWFTSGGQQGVDNAGTTFAYPNDQEAATIWYHDHAMGITRLNVYAGLAGFYIVHDTNENALIANHTLPDEKYDIPLAIQDRQFTADGQLYYPADLEEGTTAQYPSVHPEFFGDVMLVNGQAWPVLDVEPRMYRFRIVDGSQARFYNLQLDELKGSPHMNFFQVGTDGGLLESPEKLKELLIGPGERADIVIDFSKLAGKTILMKNNANAPYPSGDPDDPQHDGPDHGIPREQAARHDDPGCDPEGQLGAEQDHPAQGQGRHHDETIGPLRDHRSVWAPDPEARRC